MAPRNAGTTISENGSIRSQVEEEIVPPEYPQQKRPPMQIVWRNVIWFIYLHLAALYGLYLLPSAKLSTIAFTVMLYYFSAWGITAGAHRLWAHKSYKAKMPFRIILAIFQTMAFQNDIIEWSRDHRVHHKYSETEADPHNAKRGFFFAHCGWLMVRKHPEVKEKGKSIDLSDLYNDPVCAVQRKIYKPAMILMCFIVPTFVPWYYWGENGYISFFVCAILRYVLVLNFTWCVNSVAHMFGNKPYDKTINPVENVIVTCGAAGEGFHNYHHVFPHDYAASEFGTRYNPTTMLIDFFAAIGQVYDRKIVPRDLVDRRKLRTGDGTEGFDSFSSFFPSRISAKPATTLGQHQQPERQQQQEESNSSKQE